jgi:hypothetical protein
MERTPKVRVKVNRVPQTGTLARLIQVHAGQAHYRCERNNEHQFAVQIENPFDAEGPSPAVNCTFSHTEVAL